VIANTHSNGDQLSRDGALNGENSDSILAELTFGAPSREKISWLEYWFYMCNQSDDIEA